MSTSIRTQIIKIGNSQGIRIPKILLEQSGIHHEVDIEVEGNQLTIRKASQPREGWEQAFTEMAAHQDDQLIDESISTEWDQTEWEW